MEALALMRARGARANASAGCPHAAAGRRDSPSALTTGRVRRRRPRCRARAGTLATTIGPDSLIALAQLLNGPTRAALSRLRAGGNRSGAEAALTWQTGYPMRVSSASGATRGTSPVAPASTGCVAVGPMRSWWRASAAASRTAPARDRCRAS